MRSTDRLAEISARTILNDFIDMYGSPDDD
jgi:hypothetical protein